MQSTFLKSHFIDLLFVMIFLLCLCIPNLHLSSAEKSVEENRMLAKYIPLIYDKKINWNYGADFEKFYNDRFYCRRKLIEIGNLLKQKVFPVIRTENVIKGKQGWLFLNCGTEYNFVNYNLFDEAKLHQGLKYLQEIKSWCDANGKVFVFLICPDKNKIYGEYFPDGYKKVRPDTESRAFQFLNYSCENSDISIVYPYEELLAEKASGRLLYHKNDTHWNFAGACVGYKELMKEIQKNLDIDEVKIIGNETEKHSKGDLNNHLFPEVKILPDETTIYNKPNVKSEFKYIKGGPISKRDFHHVICDEKKYNAVFFRDSFVNALEAYVANTFKESIYHWRYKITSEDLAYIKDNADIVILECVERLLPNAVLNTFPQTEIQQTEATK